MRSLRPVAFASLTRRVDETHLRLADLLDGSRKRDPVAIAAERRPGRTLRNRPRHDALPRREQADWLVIRRGAPYRCLPAPDPMKPYRQLAEARTPDGTLFSLHHHDGQFYLKNDGHDLMSTALTCSEEMLADIGCDFATRPASPRILIGGLGLGFSLKRVLEIVGTPARVQVAEIVPEVVAWNREFLAERNGPLLDDARTTIYLGDVYRCIRDAGPGSFDAILLDVDDTPGSLVLPQNNRLYTPAGLEMIRKSLAPGGRVAFWLAEPAPRFFNQMKHARFRTSEFHARTHARSKRARHRIYLGER